MRSQGARGATRRHGTGHELPGPGPGALTMAERRSYSSGTVPCVSQPGSATDRSVAAHRSSPRASHPGRPQVPTPPRGVGARLRTLLSEHLRPTVKFLIVGGVVFGLDALLYNLLVFWHPSDGWAQGLMHSHPLTAKLLTIAAASCLTYLGNRLWTFGDRPRPDTARSIMLFVLINLIAAGLQLACLGFSRYVLGLDSVLADNISGTIIGQILSTSFRYITYGRFVFPRGR